MYFEIINLETVIFFLDGEHTTESNQTFWSKFKLITSVLIVFQNVSNGLVAPTYIQNQRIYNLIERSWLIRNNYIPWHMFTLLAIEHELCIILNSFGLILIKEY